MRPRVVWLLPGGLSGFPARDFQLCSVAAVHGCGYGVMSGPARVVTLLCGAKEVDTTADRLRGYAW